VKHSHGVNKKLISSTGYFVACFDITLMASVHPVITSYFNASNEASWLTTAFMITNTGFQPLWGRLSDMVGRKSVYLVVLSIFALTNLWCALSQSIGSFIAARAVCGIGAGGTMSMGLVVVNDLVKVEYRGTYISHINVAFGIGAACGAAFGGVISDSM
jgi:MFS family permease